MLMPRPLLLGEVSPQVTERLYEGTLPEAVKQNGNAACSTTSQSSLRDASSPGRGASGEEAKFAQCQSLSYKERCHRR